jgi:molybdopterin-guanine dinucleotide biosynthesis protein
VRGCRVGSVKTIRHHPLSLEPEGADTRRHAEAGAEFTVVLLDGGLAYFEPRMTRPGPGEAARLFRPGVEYVVWEGRADPASAGAQVVCLKEMADLDRTLEARQVPADSIIAISGVAAGATAGGGSPGPLAGVPVVDALQPAGAAALADLVVRWFEEGGR